jgi:hypothetical protein
MFNSDKLAKTIVQNIINNCILADSSVYKPNDKMSGINISFKDGTSGILWAYDKGDKYFFNFKAFDTILKIPLTRDEGDDVWIKFMDKFGPNNYSIKEI